MVLSFFMILVHMGPQLTLKHCKTRTWCRKVMTKEG